MSDMKTCTKCKAEKPATEFHKDKQKKGGLRPDCKTCNCLRVKAVYADSPERAIEASAAWRAAYPERARASVRAWAKANPDRMSAHHRNRRAVIRQSEGTHTAADIKAILESQRGLCANCTSKLFKSGANKFHVDHIQPIAKGGSNDKYNLQCLCPGCNQRKWAKDPLDWAKENGKLV